MEQLKVKVLLQHQGDQLNACFLNIRRLFSYSARRVLAQRPLPSMQETEKSSLENLTNPRGTKDINMGLPSKSSAR